MTDLSKLSDDELLAMHEAATAPKPAATGDMDLSKLSDDELLAMHARATAHSHDAEPAASPENPHELVPFLKNTARGLWQGVKGAAGSAVDAAVHPVDTMANLGEWMVMGGGPGGDSDQALVSGRTLRHIPVAGVAYDNARALADPEYKAKTDAEDAQFAKDHPTLAKAQDTVGGSAGLLAGPLVGAGLYTVDAYHRSRMQGNDPETAMQDARNAAALIAAGTAVTKTIGAARGAIADQGLGDAAKGLAEEKAFKAAVGNQAKVYNEASARGVINARGRELLDSGTVGFGDSAQNIADKAGVQKIASGEAIGDMLQGFDEAAPHGVVSGPAMADKIRAHAQAIGGSGNKPLVQSLLDAADDLEAEGNMTFAKAQVHKNSWDWHPGSSVTQKVARQVKGIIGDEMETAIGRVGEQPPLQVIEPPANRFSAGWKPGGAEPIERPAVAPSADPVTAAVGQAGADLSPVEQQALATSMKSELAQAEPAAGAAPQADDPLAAYQDEKSRYGTMAAAQKDAQVNANRYAKNNAASLGDKAAAVAGAALNPHGTAFKLATGAASGLANKLIRKRGASALAVSLDKIGDLLNANPEAFGKFAAPLQAAAARGPQALAVTHYMLSQQEPEYSKMMGTKP